MFTYLDCDVRPHFLNVFQSFLHLTRELMHKLFHLVILKKSVKFLGFSQFQVLGSVQEKEELWVVLKMIKFTKNV